MTKRSVILLLLFFLTLTASAQKLIYEGYMDLLGLESIHQQGDYGMQIYHRDRMTSFFLDFINVSGEHVKNISINYDENHLITKDYIFVTRYSKKGELRIRKYDIKTGELVMQKEEQLPLEYLFLKYFVSAKKTPGYGAYPFTLLDNKLLFRFRESYYKNDIIYYAHLPLLIDIDTTPFLITELVPEKYKKMMLREWDYASYPNNNQNAFLTHTSWDDYTSKDTTYATVRIEAIAANSNITHTARIEIQRGPLFSRDLLGHIISPEQTLVSFTDKSYYIAVPSIRKHEKRLIVKKTDYDGNIIWEKEHELPENIKKMWTRYQSLKLKHDGENILIEVLANESILQFSIDGKTGEILATGFQFGSRTTDAYYHDEPFYQQLLALDKKGQGRLIRYVHINTTTTYGILQKKDMVFIYSNK
jgi:hypothetical protein